MKVRFLLDENLSLRLGRLAQELLLIWESSEAEEWVDKLDWIPF